MEMISAQGLKNEMKDPEKPFSVIDVRESGAYQEKHLPGAMNVPKGEGFLERLGRAVAAEDTVIVLYDEHEEMDGDLEALCRDIEGAGFTQVHCLSGGLLGWMEAGGRVEFQSAS